MITISDVFYQVYDIDEHGNKRVICGARSAQIAEETLRKHNGYENATIEWKRALIYSNNYYPTICEGIAHR